jgi:hypothetical protein
MTSARTHSSLCASDHRVPLLCAWLLRDLGCGLCAFGRSAGPSRRNESSTRARFRASPRPSSRLLTLRFAAAGASGEITMDQITQQFGFTSPLHQKAEEPVARSNNDIDGLASSEETQDVTASADTAGEEQAEGATELLETGEACEKEISEPTPVDELTPDWYSSRVNCRLAIRSTP